MEKKLVQENKFIDYIENLFQDATLEEVISNLKEKTKKYNFTNFTFSVWNDDISINFERYETDEEYYKRLENEKTSKEKRRKQYEELKKEFE